MDANRWPGLVWLFIALIFGSFVAIHRSIDLERCISTTKAQMDLGHSGYLVCRG